MSRKTALRIARQAAAAVAVSVGALLAAAGDAEAVYISSFSQTTNDGVFSLTAQQAAFLGTPTADRLGFLRVRSNPAWGAGDTFDAQSILSTKTGGSVLGIFNGVGDPSLIQYTGNSFQSLGTTTLLTQATGVYRAVAFAFNSTGGNIVFRGTSTFAGAQTLGQAPSPVPVPAALPLMLGALAGLGLVARRKADA